MDFLEIINNSKSQLIFSSNYAIIEGMQTIWARCIKNGKKPQEPDFVSGLVMESIPIISKMWKSILKPYNINISIASVFCHQTPKVHFNGMIKNSCELGDILIAHIHNNNNGDVFRNAILYQSKVSSKQPYPLKSSELDQLSLYYSWPEFEYVNSGKLSGEIRNVLPKMPHTGAQYMLIDDRSPMSLGSGYVGFPNAYIIGTCMPSHTLYDHSMLEYELFNFLSLRTGRYFYDIDYSNDDWSTIVWDLLKAGLNNAFNRKRSGYINIKRNKSFDSSFYFSPSSRKEASTIESILGYEKLSMLFNDSGNFPPNREFLNDNFNEENFGTSLILIETNNFNEE
jgi:hypothetical protein